MKQVIKSSFINIKLVNKHLEKEYQKEIFTNACKYAFIIGIANYFLQIASIVISLVFTNRPAEDDNHSNIKSCFYVTLVVMGILVLNTLLRIFFFSQHIVKTIFIILTYFIFGVTFSLIRYEIVYSELTNDVVHIIYYLELVIKFILTENEHLDFTPNLFVQLSCFITTLLFQTFLFGWSKYIIIYFIVGSVLKFTSVVFSFYFFWKKRILFYWNYKMKETNEWYQIVLDSFNSGFVKITNDNISFINKNAFDTFYKCGIITQSYQSIINSKKNPSGDSKEDGYRTEEEENNFKAFLEKNEIDIINGIISMTNFEEIFKRIPVLNGINRTQTYPTDANLSVNQGNDPGNKLNEINLSQSEKKLFLDKLKNLIVYEGKGDKFYYLTSGSTANKSLDDDISYFEIYGRYYYSEEEGDTLELIFNDITSTKIEEEKNHEIKYKSEVLAKICHEFKNPLICLTGIIEEELQDQAEKVKNYGMISSLANYLIILIKDIESVTEILRSNPIQKSSQKSYEVSGEEMEKKGEKRINSHNSPNFLINYNLNISKINLNDAIDFISKIAQYLIQNKNGSGLKLEYIFEKDSELPREIYTDEIKLKQVLINLISNSIKFTSNGKITLKVGMEDLEEEETKNKNKYIKFSVIDEGAGISKENLKEIFNCFSKAKFKGAVNKMGAGVGLMIVREMTSLLGKTIQVKSEEGKGSTFWFYLKLLGPEDGAPLDNLDGEEDSYFKDQDSLEEDSQATIQLSNNEWTQHCKNDYCSDKKLSQFLGLKPISKESEHKSIKSEKIEESIEDNAVNILIVDDEVFGRNAIKNKLNEFTKKNGIISNFILGIDGIEILNRVCNYIKYTPKGSSFFNNDKTDKMEKEAMKNRIDIIISDENMNIMNGSPCAEIIYKMEKYLKFDHIPFYISTADSSNQTNKAIDQFVHKPISEEEMKKIFKNYI
ncbi:MAG: ATP-binding protein [archaeon]|nr:ATP-binding protein [archaeon]